MVESVQHETERSLHNEAAAARSEEQSKARARLDAAIQNVRNHPLLSSERRAELLAQLDDMVNASPAAIERALADVASQLPAASAEASYEMVGNAGVAKEEQEAYEYARSECVRTRMEEITEGNIQKFTRTFIEDDGILTEAEQQGIAKTVSEVMQPRILELNKHSATVRGAATLAGHTAKEQLKAMQDDPAFAEYKGLLRYISREKVIGDPAVAELVDRIHRGEKIDIPAAYSKVGETSIGIILDTQQYHDAVAAKLPAALRRALDKQIDSEDHVALVDRGHEIMQQKGERLKTVKAINDAIAHGQSLDGFTPEQIKDAAAYKYTSYMDTMGSIVKFERMSERAEQLIAAKAKGEKISAWGESLIKNMEIINDVHHTLDERVAAYKEMNKNDPGLKAMMASMDPAQLDKLIGSSISTFDAKGGISKFKGASAAQRADLVEQLGVVDSLLAASDSFGKGYDAIQQGNTKEAEKQAQITGKSAAQLLEATGLISKDSARTVGGVIQEALANTAVSTINAQNVAKNAVAAAGELMKGNFSNALAALDLDSIKAKMAGVTVKELNAKHDPAVSTSQQAVAANATAGLSRDMIR